MTILSWYRKQDKNFEALTKLVTGLNGMKIKIFEFHTVNIDNLNQWVQGIESNHCTLIYLQNNNQVILEIINNEDTAHLIISGETDVKENTDAKENIVRDIESDHIDLIEDPKTIVAHVNPRGMKFVITIDLNVTRENIKEKLIMMGFK